MKDYLSPYLHRRTPTISRTAVTDKEKVELWFIEPLSAMKGNEAFLCLTVCFPLLETVIRSELDIPDEKTCLSPTARPRFIGSPSS